MAQGFRPPPAILANARTLEYADLGDEPNYSGHSSLFVNGEELGPVPCLAICQDPQGSGYLFLHRDRNWNVLGVSAYPSVRDAKKHANKVYPGVNEKWTRSSAGGAQEDTAAEADPVDSRCAICGRKPEEVTAMIDSGRIRICDRCIRELYQMLGEKD